MLTEDFTSQAAGRFYCFTYPIFNRKASVFVKTSLVKGRGTARKRGGGIHNPSKPTETVNTHVKSFAAFVTIFHCLSFFDKQKAAR